MTSVFDVAVDLVDRVPGQTMNTVKLQKLCFYAFGWYAHLTGEPLFDEAFYAMPKGPVVGELLSAHAGRKSIGHKLLIAQLTEREAELVSLQPYERAVLDAVWDAYGRESQWHLVDKSHSEDVWDRAWRSRPEGSKRGTMRQREMIDYFLTREVRAEEHLQLPPPVLSFLSTEDRKRIDAHTSEYRPFVERLRAFKAS